jgi:hypothetical protein
LLIVNACSAISFLERQAICGIVHCDCCYFGQTIDLMATGRKTRKRDATKIWLAVKEPATRPAFQ